MDQGCPNGYPVYFSWEEYFRDSDRHLEASMQKLIPQLPAGSASAKLPPKDEPYRPPPPEVLRKECLLSRVS